MQNKQLTLPGTTVKKHNELIRSKVNINNVNSTRILASLIACISSKDSDFNREYSIDVSHVLPDETGGRNYKYIKTACRDLAEATAEIEDVESEHYKIFTFYKKKDNI